MTHPVTTIALAAILGIWQTLSLEVPFNHRQKDQAMSAALRLHSPEQDPKDLMSVFTTYIKPELDVRGQAKTAKAYVSAIAKFTEFLTFGMITSSNHANPNSDGFLSDATLVAWQTYELNRGLKPSSINTHAKYLRAVLRRMGPREKGNPKGIGILASVPHLSPLTTPRPRVNVVDLKTLDAIYVYGCPDMDWPDQAHCMSACKIWRAWLVCAYNLAMRTRDLMGLKWEAIHWEPQSLDPDSSNESPYGWIEWVPAKTRTKKPEPLVLPLHRTVRTHLEAIRHDGDFVFGHQFARASDRKLYGQEGRPGQWYRLLDFASSHKPIPRFEIRAIRRTANSQYNRVDRKLGAHVLGHSPRGVNDLFYQQWERDAVELMAQLPQPASFAQSQIDSPRQFMMF